MKDDLIMMNLITLKIVEMKKLKMFAIAIFLPVMLMAQQNAADKFFEKYANEDGFTTISINRGLLNLVSELDDDMETKSLLKCIESVKVLTTKYEINGLNFYDEIVKNLPKDQYEELITVKDSDEQVKILIDEKNGIIHELLIVTGGKDENALIILKGNIELNKVSELSSSIDIDGLEVLRDLESGL